MASGQSVGVLVVGIIEKLHRDKLSCGCSLNSKTSDFQSDIVGAVPATRIMLRKRCCRCRRYLGVNKFKSRKLSKDGLQAQCIVCHKAYRRRHYLKNKQKYIKKAKTWMLAFRKWYRAYKSTFSCVHCGEAHPACIHFHHYNNDKKFNVAHLANTGSKKLVMLEISKCIALCANCHSKLHWKS